MDSQKETLQGENKADSGMGIANGQQGHDASLQPDFAIAFGRIFACLCVLLLAGCVHDADYGQIERSPLRLLEKLTVTRTGDYQTERFAYCVKKHAKRIAPPARMQKRPATIVDDSGRTVLIGGNTRWDFAFVPRYLSFRLTAQNYGQRFYTFEEVKSGALYDGMGDIFPIAASGLEGRRALQALVDVVDTIEQCQQESSRR